MISRLRGNLIEKNPPVAVIDIGGVGYEVQVSMNTFYRLPPLQNEVMLYIQTVIREDAHTLFGFADNGERETFRQLVKVSGIGAKTALGILSAVTGEELAQAVADEDIARLSSAPGIGKKTAERMILELRGKLATAVSGSTATASGSGSSDIVNTLLALGYNEREARAACKDIPAGTDVGEGVKLALRNLVK